MTKRIILLGALVAAVILTGVSCLTTGGTAQGPMGMFRSADKGETWGAIQTLPSAQGVQSIAGLKIFRIFEDPGDPNAMYLGTRGQGLYYTYNNGDTWQAVSAMNGKFIYALAVNPKDKCTIYVSDGPNIYKTEDCSRSWKLVYTEQRTGQRMVAMAVDFGDDKTVYAAELGGDILLSQDGGGSWRVVKRFGFDLQHLVADPFKAGRIYVATYRNGLFRSDDIGANWTDLSSGLDPYSDSKNFYRLVLNNGQKDSLYWVSKYGILRSDDAGNSWKDLKLITPPGSVNIYAFAVNPNNAKEMYYTGTILGDQNVHVRSTFYKTVDGGTNWVTKKLPTNTVPAAIRIHPTQNNVLFMGFTILN